MEAESESRSAWQDAAAVKRRQLWKDVPQHWELSQATVAASRKRFTHAITMTITAALSAAEKDITSRPTAQLLAAIAAGTLSSLEVLEAFAHRAMLSHQLVSTILLTVPQQTTTNCLSESNLTAARIRARELDAYWREHASTVGPLHGLPVSLMDRFHVAGLDSACGFTSWTDKPCMMDEEGVLVRKLRHLGAVIHCKSNVPMSMMLGETTNNIIGTTTNPFNTALSAGGACGGEGALLALGASRLGIGTDVAGSSRIPAAFCGLWSFKCSQDRLPSNGVGTVLSGLPVAAGAIGLLSTEYSTLASSVRHLIDSHLVNSDPNYLQLPWRQEGWDFINDRRGSPALGTGRLVFGMLLNDGHVRPHPSIQRALDTLTRALVAAGHEVVEWNPPAHAPAVHTLFEILGSTSAQEARAAIDASGEPCIPQIADWYQNEDMEPNSTSEFWNLCAQLNEFRTRYKTYWNGVGSSTRSGRHPDGVILPVAATLAVRPGEFLYYGYSAIANVLDYPSGVFPIAFGDGQLDIVPSGIEPLSDLDKKVQQSFRAIDTQGMPVGLQVMGPRLQEETVLCLMDVIQESLQQFQSCA